MKFSQTVKITFLLIIAGLIIQNCENSKPQKIKLAQDYDMDTEKPKTDLRALQIYPNEKLNIAIFKFKNQTKESSLDWLQRGLIDLFSNKLSQSPYFNVVNAEYLNRLTKEILKDRKSHKEINLITARKSNARILLSGQYYYEGDSLCIEAELINVNSGKLIKVETVRGKGLEQIFSLITNLSEKIKSVLIRENSEKLQAAQDFSEITTSVKAFRCYSKALEYYDKFIWDKVREFLTHAIEYDSTFAIAYFKLAMLEFDNGNKKQGEHYLSLAQKYEQNLTHSEKIGLNLYKIMQEKGFEFYMKALEDAVKQNPYEIEFRIVLARQYRKLGFFDKALDQFEIALDYEPSRKSLYNDIAYAYMLIGDYPSALRAIDRYSQLSPNEPNPYDSKGEILMQAGHFKKAKKEFSRALKIYPDFINSVGRIAEIDIFTANKEEAKKYIDRLAKMEYLKQGWTDFSQYQFFYYWKFAEFNKLKKLISDRLNQKEIQLDHIFLAADFYKSQGDSAKVNLLYKKAFSYYKKVLKTGINYNKQNDRFRKFAIVSGYKPLEAVQILKKELTTKISEQRKMDLNFTLGLLSARGGRSDDAKKYYDAANLNNFHEILKKIRNASWKSTWKYVFESLKYANKGLVIDQFSADKLLEIAKKSDRKDLEVLAYMMKGQYYKQNNKTKEMGKQFRLAGIPLEKKWLIIGPFNTVNINGFDYNFISEESLNPQKSVQFKGNTYQWHTIDDHLCDGYIDLKTALNGAAWRAAYAAIKVYSPAEKRVQIRFSAKKSSKVFLNDKMIWQHYNFYSDFIDQDIITVILHPGYNTILLKLVNNINNWGFYFRITDEKGDGLSTIKYLPINSTADENGFAKK